jgi:hypothetical protein
MYVMADIVTPNAQNETHLDIIQYWYISLMYLHYVCTYFVSTDIGCIYNGKLQPHHRGQRYVQIFIFTSQFN